jgi:WD40 repeat protein/tRNA A-37 threonylcarbamoyl transferase component Bud32
MTTLLCCVNGHAFDASVAAGSADQALVCPVCGAPERTLLTGPSLPESAPAPALRLPGRPPAETPPSLADFEVLEEIGRGGMGVVYKARQRDTGRTVALKVIRKERLGSPDMVARFRREVQASSRLQHPNVVEVFASDLEGDTHYLAMEYVPGITLQRLVEDTAALPLALACAFVRQAALGLQHAHEKGLVHRDVKPANLMVLAPAGLPLPPRPALKILDMGVARLFQLSELEASLTTLTRDGSVIGTPDYIAPEQLENPRGVDIRADLYSLGCTFYFLLTGQVPFPGGTLVQKLDRQRWHTAPGVNQLRPEAPPPLAAVVRRLMAKHPDDRYQTPGELAGALETLQRTGQLPAGDQPAPIVELRRFAGHGGAVSCVAFSEGGRSVVSGGADRTLRLCDVASGREKLRFGDLRHEVACLAVVEPSGVVLAGQGVTVRGWDAEGREVLKLSGHNGAVRSVAVSADGKRAASGGDDRTVRVWDLERGREVYRFTRHRDSVTGVALSADGRLVLSGSRDQTLRLWEAANGKEVQGFPVPRGPVLCAALTPDGGAACSGHFDTTLRLWDLRTGRERRRLIGHKQMVVGVWCLPGGRLLSASHDQTVRLWDADSGAELASCVGHAGPVAAVAASPDGKTAASAGGDQTVRLWQLPG